MLINPVVARYSARARRVATRVSGKSIPAVNHRGVRVMHSRTVDLFDKARKLAVLVE